jgi:hypothetical protein
MVNSWIVSQLWADDQYIINTRGAFTERVFSRAYQVDGKIGVACILINRCRTVYELKGCQVP